MIFAFGDFELDKQRAELHRNAEAVPLRRKVYLLLLFLIENRERMVSRDEIIEVVWNGRIVSESTIDSCIKSARKAIGDNGKDQLLIKTLRGSGLRFVGELNRDDKVPVIPTTHEQHAAQKKSATSIAVMPFENLSSDPDNDYLVDGIGEEITSGLGRLPWLFVIARNSAVSYKGKSYEVADAARELNVRYILVGNVRKSGESIRISVQLIDGLNSAHLWSTRFDRQMGDVFEIQDEISERIVGALEPQVSLAETKKAMAKPEQDLDAWDCVMRAMALKGEYSDAGSAEAINLLERALEIDPQYARAYALLGWIVMWRVHQGWEDVEPALARARDAAERAIKYDQNELWAYIALGFVATITKDTEMLVEASKRSIDINPSFAVGHSWVGAALAITGDGANAFQWIEKGRELSPRDILKDEFDVHESFAHFQVAAYPEAYAAAHSATIAQPDHIYPRLIMAASLGHQRKLDEAADELEQIRSLAPDLSLEAARTSSVFCDDELLERFVEGLRLAGLT
ncbi:MAG: winged helix-turn-helix domain-containing protein [Pseudomonadota bacterium]